VRKDENLIKYNINKSVDRKMKKKLKKNEKEKMNMDEKKDCR
jgi:hypothetical protein